MHVCVLSWVKWFTENDGLWDRILAMDWVQL